MKVAVGTKELARAVGQASVAAAKKPTIPALANLLLRASKKDGTLRIGGSDNYLTSNVRIDASIESEGVALVDHRKLSAIVSGMSTKQVKLSLSDNKLQVRSGKSKYHLHSLPIEDFPSPPKPGNGTPIRINAKDLGGMLTLTSYAMMNDEQRLHLSGVMMSKVKKKLELAATDSHRLARAEAKVKEGEVHATLPVRGVEAMKKLCDESSPTTEVSLLQSGPTIFFWTDAVGYSMKTMGAEPIPYRSHIPDANKVESTITVDRKAAVGALRRLMSMEKAAISVKLNRDKMQLHTHSPEAGDGVETLKVQVSGGDLLEVSFEGDNLLDALTSMKSDYFYLFFWGNKAPAMIRPSTDEYGFFYLLMPYVAE